MSNTSTLDEFDSIIDNFMVEIIGSNVGLDGDYNGDGSVDAADYVLWRKDPASFGGDPGGYNTWRQNFGASLGNGSGDLSAGAVPEPASLALVVMGGMLACGAPLGGLKSRPRRTRIQDRKPN